MTSKKTRLAAMALLACSLNPASAHYAAGHNQTDTLQSTLPSATSQPKGRPLLSGAAGQKLARQDYAHMEVQLNASGQAEFDGGKYQSGKFAMNGMKVQIAGQIDSRLGYLFRESFTKQPQKSATDNLSAAIDKAFVTWKPATRLKLVMGKQYIELGGYEYMLSSNRIRFYSDFNATVHCGQTGVGAFVSIAPDHTLALQLLNNSTASDTGTYAYGMPSALHKTKTPAMGVLGYRGYLAHRTLSLHYGATYGQLATNRQQLMLTAGHAYERGPVLAYLDVMYAREGIDTKGIISAYSDACTRTDGSTGGGTDWHTAQNVEYLSAIADIDYRLSRSFNVYIKGIYETGRVYRANGIYQAGRYNNTWSMQACVEYFPMSDRDLRFFLHGVYKKTDLTQLGQQVGGRTSDTMRLSIGLEYVLPVF